MSASTSKSIGSTFSSQSVTSCSRGVRPGDGRHRQVREDAALAEARQDAVVGPEALGIPRSDEMNLHDASLPLDACARCTRGVGFDRPSFWPLGGCGVNALDFAHLISRPCASALSTPMLRWPSAREINSRASLDFGPVRHAPLSSMGVERGSANRRAAALPEQPATTGRRRRGPDWRRRRARRAARRRGAGERDVDAGMAEDECQASRRPTRVLVRRRVDGSAMAPSHRDQ